MTKYLQLVSFKRTVCCKRKIDFARSVRVLALWKKNRLHKVKHANESQLIEQISKIGKL